MIRGLVSAAKGMSQQSLKQDIIANNLANVATAGYKRRTVAFGGFSSFLAEEAARNTTAVRDPRVMSRQDESQGGLQTTNSKTNLAIEGPGFFVVQSANGDELTRNGNFTMNDQGEIITSSGAKLMGQAGPITVGRTDWQIDPSGRVTSGGATVDNLRIVTRSGSGQISDVPDNEIKLVQGALETSNVSPVREMISMMANLRAYEANQKTIQAIDNTLDKLINEAGKV